MSKVLEQIVHRYAKQIRVNGVLCLSANGDQALVEVFKALGWSDPYPIDKAARHEAPLETATLEAPERAVMPGPKKRHG